MEICNKLFRKNGLGLRLSTFELFPISRNVALLYFCHWWTHKMHSFAQNVFEIYSFKLSWQSWQQTLTLFFVLFFYFLEAAVTAQWALCVLLCTRCLHWFYCTHVTIEQINMMMMTIMMTPSRCTKPRPQKSPTPSPPRNLSIVNPMDQRKHNIYYCRITAETCREPPWSQWKCGAAQCRAAG